MEKVYSVIKAKGLVQLEKLVNEHLAQGYQLQGGVNSTNNVFVQAVVRTTGGALSLNKAPRGAKRKSNPAPGDDGA